MSVYKDLQVYSDDKKFSNEVGRTFFALYTHLARFIIIAYYDYIHEQD